MNRQQILQFHPQLRLLLQYLRGVNLCLIVLTSILYFVSIYCLVKEQMVAAIGLASLAAIIFHLSQKHLLTAVKYWLYRNKNNRGMLLFLEQEIAIRYGDNASDQKKNSEIKAFFVLLEKAMKMVNESDLKRK